MAEQEDLVQREIQQDWTNREYVETITSRKSRTFSTLSPMSCHSRPTTLNEKLTALERRIWHNEVRVTKVCSSLVTRTSYGSCLGTGSIEVARIKEESALERMN